jgi:hypothetical protein
MVGSGFRELGLVGGHLGPQEPGELAGDRDHDDVAIGFAGVEAAESGA